MKKLHLYRPDQFRYDALPGLQLQRDRRPSRRLVNSLDRFVVQSSGRRSHCKDLHLAASFQQLEEEMIIRLVHTESLSKCLQMYAV